MPGLLNAELEQLMGVTVSIARSRAASVSKLFLHPLPQPPYSGSTLGCNLPPLTPHHLAKWMLSLEWIVPLELMLGVGGDTETIQKMVLTSVEYPGE
jgi:hypothetical protein